MAADEVLYDKDADLSVLEGKTVAILGFGSQGHAHALNLKDSGVDVVVGLRPDSSSRAKAEAEGLEVLDVADAASKGEVVMILLPDEKQAEFIYMVPFTPRGKDNLAAWLVARNDGDAYGKLRVYRLSRQSLVYGPQQIENRINQDTEISRQVSLWDQRGSKVIRGDLLVIPIEKSLLYVQPLYLEAEGGRIPELKRVVVAYQNQVVMQETLDGALTELFGGSAEPGGRPAAGAMAGATSTDSGFHTLAVEARRRYQAALQALRQDDWARYGDEMRQLGALLEQLAPGGSDRQR